MSLRIAFLVGGRGPAGSLHSTVKVGNELLARDHHVRIFYREGDRDFRSRVRSCWLSLRYPACYGRDWLLGFRGEGLPYRTLQAEYFAPDELIVAMSSETTFDAARVPPAHGVKVVLCRGLEEGNWQRMLASWTLPFPKIVVSSHIAAELKKETGQEAVAVVPNGVDRGEYFDSLGLPNRRAVGTIWQWREAKDPQTIMGTLRRLRVMLGGRASIHVFGSGRRPAHLRRGWYTRLPRLEGARAIYSRCRVWFHASQVEGFGLPILEAMACGCAVVSTDCGGPSDIIQDQVNGLLVQPGDADALSAGVVRVFDDDDLRTRIVAQSRRTVAEFTWERSARLLEEHLARIADGHRG